MIGIEPELQVIENIDFIFLYSIINFEVVVAEIRPELVQVFAWLLIFDGALLFFFLGLNFSLCKLVGDFLYLILKVHHYGPLPILHGLVDLHERFNSILGLLSWSEVFSVLVELRHLSELEAGL